MSELDLDALRARFVKAYAAVPAKMREEIIALVDDKPYNWNSAYLEITGKTAVGNELIKHLVLIKLLNND